MRLPRFSEPSNSVEIEPETSRDILHVTAGRGRLPQDLAEDKRIDSKSLREAS